MAILTSCCCWSSVRRGSFACAIYTIVYYSFMLFYLYESLYNADEMTEGDVESILVSQEEPTHHPAVASIAILTLGCSFAGTVTSLLLLVGLYKDVRWLLLPWIVNFLVTICLDLAFYCYSLRLISSDLNPGKAMWATIALFIIILNIYAVLCVISQFQQYNAGRGRAEDDWPDTPPAVRYTRQSSVNIRMDSTRRSVALIVDSGTTTVNGLSPSHTTTTMATRSPSLNPKECDKHSLCKTHSSVSDNSTILAPGGSPGVAYNSNNSKSRVPRGSCHLLSLPPCSVPPPSASPTASCLTRGPSSKSVKKHVQFPGVSDDESEDVRQPGKTPSEGGTDWEDPKPSASKETAQEAVPLIVPSNSKEKENRY
ncbi:uncharacterized protein LOC143021735 [Oratosquilla oratoria]|uniref:uncharacterized protein LOC143021735 n=1 Tax=Oratosquilla oratoria TaxID=337810 RepID=UPI003F759BAF